MDRLIETEQTTITTTSELARWIEKNKYLGPGVLAVIDTHSNPCGYYMTIRHYERRDWIERQMQDMEHIPVRRAPRIYEDKSKNFYTDPFDPDGAA